MPYHQRQFSSKLGMGEWLYATVLCGCNYVSIPKLSEKGAQLFNSRIMVSLFFMWCFNILRTHEASTMANCGYRRENGNIFRVTGPLCGEFTVTSEFPSQRPVTRSCDVFFHLRPNKPLGKQSWGWWFETPSCSLWRHCNIITLEW